MRNSDSNAHGLAKRYAYCSCYRYTYCSRYGYTYGDGNRDTNRNTKLHTGLHIHIGDRNASAGSHDTGNHCDDCTTVISLPFSVTLYDQTFTSANVGSNGILAFGTNNNGFSGSCLPVTGATYQAMPFYRDQRTDTVSGCTGCGIFTTTTGTAPNRVFRVEYRTTYFGETSATPTLDYEVNLYESGSPAFDYTYGLINSTITTGRITSIGVQENTTLFTQYACDTTGQTPPVATGQKLTASLAPCGSPTPTATPTTTASATPSCTPGWSAGADLPSVGVRAVGVYFPANGKFYAMGGRSSDVAGSDFMHPFEYNPGTNSWTTKAATYPDNQVNNMACGVLTVSGTPYIYCVGGSAAGAATATARVFFYNPVTDVITSLTSADNWPGDAAGTILPGGFAVTGNDLYILGGFNINVASTNEIWQFDPTAAVGSKWLQRVNTPDADHVRAHSRHRWHHLRGRSIGFRCCRSLGDRHHQLVQLQPCDQYHRLDSSDTEGHRRDAGG